MLRSLRNKIVLIFSTLITLIFAITYLYSSQGIEHGFLKIESKEATSDMTRVHHAFDGLKKNIHSKLNDWAQWDDSYKFIEDKNLGFKKSNLLPSITMLGFNIFSFWDKNRKLVWGSSLDLVTTEEDKKLYPMSLKNIKILESIPELYTFKNSSDQKFIFIGLDDGPYLLSSAPITNTLGNASVNGALIAAIKLDDAFFNKLGIQLDIDIRAYAKADPLFQITKQKYLENLSSQGESIDLRNLQTLFGRILFQDNLKNDLFIVESSAPRDIYQQSLITNKSQLYSILLSSIVLIVILLFAIEWLVVRKLFIANQIITQVRETGDLTLRIPSLGNDEIGDLSTSFNKMLLEVENLRAANFQNEKMASLGEMAGGIAHEINNPISIISLTTSIMKKMHNRGILDHEKYIKQIEDIDKTVMRISKIITGLRNVSRDSAGEQFVLGTLTEVLEDSVSICGERLKVNGIKFNIDFSNPAFLVKTKILRVQLSQVIYNLIGNSFDAIESMPNPWISITASLSEKAITLKFIDSGNGIPLDIQSKIFQPFYTTKEIGKGTGLGLSLSATIVQKHGGDFYIDNSHANTCFVIVIPISEL